VLEIACGSARDSLFLKDLGKHVVATDANADVIGELGKRFRDTPGIAFRVEDASRLSFADRQFDVSFHSGFYVCFDDDEAIKSLLREQCRVTRHHAFFFVHNAHNRALQDRFRSAVGSDQVFDIRFFSREDVATIVRDSGVAFREMRIGAFGGPGDILLQKRLKGLPNPAYRFASRYLRMFYRFTPLGVGERLACHLML
jgi:SAM-dependent methyltransferase